MKLKKQSLTKHSVIMLFRSKKNYILLSFTIVLSFAVLLGFLVYTDTISYNQYKTVYASPPNALLVNQGYDPSNTVFSAFLSSVKTIDPESEYYTYIPISSRLTQYSSLLYVTANAIPDGNPPIITDSLAKNPKSPESHIFIDYIYPINIIEGRKDITGNEALMNESLFNFLSPDHELPFTLNMPISYGEPEVYDIVTVEIVGVFEDVTDKNVAPHIDEDGRIAGAGSVYCNISIFNDEIISSTIASTQCQTALITTNKPLEVAKLAQANGLVRHSGAEMRQQANESMRNTSSTKMYVSMMLFIILGINLFGCFENALSERRFEIGVKRALGAPNFAIIQQFLTESCLIILIDILVSVALIFSIMIGYKLYMLLAHDYVLTIHISSYSAAMFGVCSLCMTVLFSTLFAYRATRIEIVKYLKCE